MNNARMIDYINHIAQYVTETSLLLMDRLSSHTAGIVRRHIDSKTLNSGDKMFIPIYLPPKTAFLISPLDMGAISAFKSHFHKLERSTLQLKLRSVIEAWNQVSNDTLSNIFRNCGIIGDESLSSIRDRFHLEIGSVFPPHLQNFLTFFEAWNSRFITVHGANQLRGVNLEKPQQLPEGELDGVYWVNFGGAS